MIDVAAADFDAGIEVGIGIASGGGKDPGIVEAPVSLGADLVDADLVDWLIV